MANIGEIFNGDNCFIKFYDSKPNIYSEQKFCQDSIEIMGKDNSSDITLNNNETENIWDNFYQSTQMFVDGTYFSYELAKEVLKKGISLRPGEQADKKPALDKIPYCKFKINLSSNKKSKGPVGKTSDFSIYYENTETFAARFPKEICENCSLKVSCRVKEIKDSHSIKFYRKQYEISKLRGKN